MMRPGMHKPPIAPKPKLVQPQKPGLSPSTPVRDGLSLLSLGAPRRVKPALAPKPCLSKLTPAVQSKPLMSKTLHQPPVREAQRNEGLLNSQKEIQHETKKPDWDYIIPICLCSHENCTCIRNTSANIDKMEKDLKHLHKATGNTEENKKPLPAPQVTVDNKMITSCGKSYLTNHKPLQNILTVERNLNTDNNNITRLPGPHRTWSDEANGNAVPQNEAGQGLDDDDDDAFGSEQTSQSKPAFASPRKPAPVLWKPRMAVLTHQEKVEEEREDTTSQEGIEINVKEVKVLLEGKKISSLSAGVPVEKQPALSAGKACAVPDPPPRMKPFLTTPAKASTSGVRSLPKDVEEEDLGWDSSSHEMDLSFDQGDEVVEEKKEEICDQEAACTDFTRSPGGSLCPSIRVTIDEELIKAEKSQRPVGAMAWMRLNESSKEKEEEKVMDNEKSGTPLKDEQPLSPAASRTFLTPAPIKPSRASLSKQKSKSFSGADLIHSEGQRRNSFRKLLELKLTKLITKGGQSPDGAANYIEQSVDGEHFLPERKLSCPLIGVEQCVDGDDLHYENMSYYEDISDYVNMAMGSSVTAPLSPSLQHTAWQSPAYDDEGIYEDPEQYVSFARNTELQQCLTPTDCERSSVDEEVAPFDDGHSGDDILANSSDEEDDSSSISSKGDPERPEERQTRHGQKKKIHHIAREIMTSEGVFVDVLKLLHIDFRGAVSKASRQIGKPVIEDCLLNQILYSLPQLYELNQDLLRELEQRVVKWDEHAQLADIFLKKGPYLKMYSTYIREFDKNVALLEEQSKRNPAFGAVVREFEASPRCANLALKHYLLKPVQRIPQYRLLLTDYLKNLSEDSDDYKDTQAALAIVKEVANHANDIMKQGDNFQKLFEVQSSLTGHHELVQPGRVFLKEGVLNKLSRKVMQPRMFFLFNDTLLYTTPVQSGQYKLKNMMSLAGLKVSKPSQEAYQNELNIESVERSFILSASSASERDEWLEAISRAINDYTKKKISFIPGKPLEEVDLLDSDDDASLGSKAPIWIPDSRTTMCMICTCDFTLTWRRHHCRACGKVVCQSCSSNKWCLAYRKNELGRVCDKCFLILRQQKSKQALPASVSPANKAALAFSRKHKKIPAALKEVSANTDSSMSGYLQRSKGNKKQGKRLWFVIKDKVLYTYAASEDIAALESQPMLGFVLKVDSLQKLQFKLYHKNTLYYMFKADDLQTAQRWIESFKEATVL